MRIVFLLFATLGFANALQAQLDTSFSKTFGTLNEDRGVQLRAASDGNLLITGSTGVDEQNSGADMYLLKVDTLGNRIWSFAVGATEIEQATDVVEMSNGNFLLVGYSNSFSLGDYDVFVAQVSAMGTLVSLETYGGADWDQAYGITATADGGYAIVGESYSYQNGVSQGLVIKLNAAGTLEWMNNWGGGLNDGFTSVTSLPSGVLVAAGYSEKATDDKDMWAVGVSVFGDSLWTIRHGSSANEQANDVAVFGTGNIALAGYTEKHGTGKDFYYFKTNTTGDSLYVFDPSYSGEDELRGVDVDRFGDLLFAGTSDSPELNGLGYEAVFYRIAANDVYLHGTTFGYNQDDEGHAVRYLTERGYYLVGTTNSYGQGLNDVWLIRTLDNGNWQNQIPTQEVDNVNLLTSAASEPQWGKTSEVSIYPNPVVDVLVLETTGISAVTVMTLQGKTLVERAVHDGINALEMAHLPPGNYAICLTDQNKHTTVKIIQKK